MDSNSTCLAAALKLEPARGCCLIINDNDPEIFSRLKAIKVFFSMVWYLSVY